MLNIEEIKKNPRTMHLAEELERLMHEEEKTRDLMEGDESILELDKRYFK